MSNWPKHQNPGSDERTATAPYNFVPLPDSIETVALDDIPGHDTYRTDTDTYTGHIEVKLTTASPLYVRCGWSPEDFDEHGKKSFDQLPDEVQQKVAQFFHTRREDEPVIPGSSLRGMLRSMVEIVSYGKVQPVSDARLIYRVIGDKTSFGERYRERLMQEDGKNQYTPLLEAGYMVKQGLDWFIRPAQKIDGTSFARILQNNVPRGLPRWHNIKNARKIWFKPGPYTYKNVKGGFIRTKFADALEPASSSKEGWQEGVHVYSGPMFSKKFDRVIYPADETAKLIPIPDDMVMAYREQVSKEQARILGNKDGVLQTHQPVFYLMENDQLVFFGHTMMLRLPYPNRPKDFVPPELRDEKQVGFAEALFGYVGLKIDQESRAGRVAVTAARPALSQGDMFLGQTSITPKILSGPKPTTIQHYLTQQTPDAQITGYTRDRKPKTTVELSHYASSTPSETVIRGHKLYWHKGKEPRIEHPDPAGASQTQLTRIRPVKPDVAFTFTIYFDNLIEIELGALLWVLDKGADPNYRLKLGMGKPLGMGAVKTEPTLYLTNRQKRYRRLFDGNGWQLGLRDDSAAVAESAPKNFEAFIKENHADAFGGEGRIEQLLSLISWPGPDPKETAYIDDLKEFRERKVLPTPTGVHRHTPEYPPDYPPNSTVKGKITTKWNTTHYGYEVELPNGDVGILSGPSRKQAKKELGNTLELWVLEVRGGVYFLDFY